MRLREKRSTQEEDARRRWNSRPILDVYLSAIPDTPPDEPLLCAERMRYIERTGSEEMKRQRYWAWRTLEYAASRSMGLDASKAEFRRSSTGRWLCEGMEFSISHTLGAVAAAVSRLPVGVDMENIAEFARRYGSDASLAPAMLRKVASAKEAQGVAAGRECETLLRLWTGKESLFKASHSGGFAPRRISCGEETVRFGLRLPPDVFVAVSGEQIGSMRVYVLGPDGAVRLGGESLESEEECLQRYFTRL